VSEARGRPRDGAGEGPLFEFRRAKTDEADRLTRIAFAGKQHWGYPVDWMELWRPDLVVTPQYIRREPVRVAERNGEVIGFTGLSTGDDGRYLEHLWLLTDCIGCGFGRALFREAVGMAREEGVGELRINSDPNAESCYVKMGAVRIGQEIYQLPGAVRREVPLLVYSIN
jgi:GNAT superfamily N-acetyltransferase